MVSIMIHYAYFQRTFCGKCPKKQSNFATTSGWYKHIHHMSISQRKKKTWDMWLRFINTAVITFFCYSMLQLFFKTIFSEEQPFKHSVGYLPVIKTWLSWDFSGSHGSDYRLLATFPRRFCRYSHVWWLVTSMIWVCCTVYIYIHMCILICISITSI